MDIIVEMKENPNKNGMCSIHKIIITEEDILNVAEHKIIMNKTFKKEDIYDLEILHIVP